MTSRMNKTGIGQCIVRAATLMINSQLVRARERRRNSLIDSKWIRRTQPRHHKDVLSGTLQRTEISFEHLLVRRRRVAKSYVGLSSQDTAMHCLAVFSRADLKRQ